MTFTVEAGMLEHCNGALVELIPCSDSLSGKEAAPVNGPCCMAVSELMLTPECLCYAASTAQGFDMKEILGLPRACRLHVKHAPTCEGRVCLGKFTETSKLNLFLSFQLLFDLHSKRKMIVNLRRYKWRKQQCSCNSQ